MKTKLLICIGILFLLASLAPFVAAQDVDKKIDSVEQEIEALKQRKLVALEKKRDELMREIQALEQKGTSPADPETTAVDTTSESTAGRNIGAASEGGAVTRNTTNVRADVSAPVTAPAVKVSAATNSASPAPAAGMPATGKATAAAAAQGASPDCVTIRLSPADYSTLQKQTCQMARTILAQRVLRKNATGEADLTFTHTNLENILSAELVQVLDIASDGEKAARFDKTVSAFLIGAQSARLDKQAGADSKSAGTTSLAVKGGVPDFLNWAVENGGAESSRDGNTLTFRVNPVGLADTLATWGNANGFIRPSDNQGLENLFRKDDGFVRVLRNTSIGLSFDISRGNPTTPVFTGDKQQLSALSFRYQFLNERDPMHPKYAKDWEAYRTTYLQPFSAVSAKIVEALFDVKPGVAVTFKNADLGTWFDGLNDELAKVTTTNLTTLTPSDEEKIHVVLETELAKLPLDKIKTDNTLVTSLNTFINARIDLKKHFDDIMKKIAKGQVITFEYTNYRNVNAPDLSNFRFILSKGFWAGADATFNGSLTMYNKKPTSTDPTATIKRIRDFDFTGQLDIPFSSFIKQADRALETGTVSTPPLFGIPVLTFAGKYQRLQSDAVMPDGAVKTGTKGDLAFGQLKLTIPINFNGLSIKLPFSITLANRTDLIKEKDVRGNFGFTLDIDPFFSALKSKLFGTP